LREHRARRIVQRAIIAPHSRRFPKS